MTKRVLGFARHAVTGFGVIAGTAYVYNSKERQARFSRPFAATNWKYNWDSREDETSSSSAEQKKEKAEKPKIGRRYIYFIRHGQYIHGRGMPASDKVLTALGEKQAIETGRRLKRLGFPFSKITSSTMVRAVQTADLIYQELTEDIGTGPERERISVERERDELLSEGAPFPPEPPSLHWKAKPRDFLQDGARIDAAFYRYFYRPEPGTGDTHEIFVCHANVIRYLVCRGLQFPPEGWIRMNLAHGSITVVLIRSDGRVVLRSLGDSSHLPPEMVTYS